MLANPRGAAFVIGFALARVATTVPFTLPVFPIGDPGVTADGALLCPVIGFLARRDLPRR